MLTGVLLLAILINYTAGVGLSGRYKYYILLSGIIANTAILGVFKYFNFFISNINTLLQPFHLSAIQSSVNLLMPVGISFYTFQNIAYLVDVYREEITPERNILRFAVFTSLFPKIIMGPIERYANIENVLKKKDISFENFSFGLRRLIIGLAKKVIIADNLDYTISAIFNLKSENLSTSTAWVGVILFSIQLYYDFSGYSDMAIGLGKMCGFTFMENFNYPYISKSIQEFWQRWHISLSTWLSDYIFKPLQFKLRYIKYSLSGIISILLTFCISGLWHGASWNFIVWGVYHGVFLAFELVFLGKLLQKTSPAVAHIYALLVISIGWVFFRTESLPQAFSFLAKMFSFSFNDALYTPVSGYLGFETAVFAFIGLIFITPVSQYSKKYYSNHKIPGLKNELPLKYSIIYLFFLLALLFISILYIAVHDYRPFLYGVF